MHRLRHLRIRMHTRKKPTLGPPKIKNPRNPPNIHAQHNDELPILQRRPMRKSLHRKSHNPSRKNRVTHNKPTQMHRLRLVHPSLPVRRTHPRPRHARSNRLRPLRRRTQMHRILPRRSPRTRLRRRNRREKMESRSRKNPITSRKNNRHREKKQWNSIMSEAEKRAKKTTEKLENISKRNRPQKK